MSAVETIRDIPVIVEHRKSCNSDPMIIDRDYDYSDSGFPFDNTRRTRDPLEDIAQRHPELAQHLQGFPRRSQRAGDQDDDEFLRRRFERPFSGGRFERFGFPFERDDFEREPQRYYEAYPEHFENFQKQPQSPPHQQPQQQQQSSSQTPQEFQQHPPQYSQEYQPQYSQQFQPQCSQQYQPTPNQQSQENQQSQQPQYQSQVSQGTQTEYETAQEPESGTQEQKGEGGQTRGRPIQQSNTCDLGQSSPDEAVDDRNQRSMSLPPENKRFTSSVNIPMGGHQGQDNGGKPQSQSGSSGSTERVIPIHVEGRDDPVLPKNVTTPSSHPHPQPQPERIFTDSPRPQTERIFGQRPEHFTQFVNRDPHRFPSDWHHSFERDFPEEDFGFGRAGSPSRFGATKQPQPQAHGTPPQYQQQHRQEASSPQGHAPSQASQQKPQPQEQKPAQDETPQQPKPQPQKQPLGPIEQIQAIQKDVSSLINKVEVFDGMPRDKNYLYLDEMLTRNLLKLDNVDTQGQDSIRQARKEAIKCIEKTISHLEAIAAANAAAKGLKMDVEQAQEASEKMETEPSQEPSAMEISPNPVSQNPEGEKEEGTYKSGEGIQQSKSGEMVANSQEPSKIEEKQSEIKSEQKETEKKEASSENKEVKQDAEVNIDNKTTEPQKVGEETKNSEALTQAMDGEVKEEKKEKKKIKKKVNKEDKEKKQ